MRYMWMGPRGGEQWVKVPDSRGGAFARIGHSSKALGLNGGAWMRNSYTTHLEYALAWNTMDHSEARKIVDMHHGRRGTGLIYLIDPVEADENILPPHWSMPYMFGEDGPPLLADRRPAVDSAPDTGRDYPLQAATFSLAPGEESRRLYIPLPPDQRLWVGAHGSGHEGAVWVQPVNGTSPVGAATALEDLSISTATRFSDSFVRGTATGVELYLANMGSDPLPFSLVGMMAQIQPLGAAATTGDFISGNGFSGGRFEGAPVVTPIQAAKNRKKRSSVAAVLVETGDWS